MNDYIKEKEKYIIDIQNGKEVTVRDLQLEILTIMDELDRVCRINDIPYCMMAGSALGIVNYKGFIPWDDDIDVCIERKYWNKFLKALDKDLDNSFYYHCFQKDKKYNVLIPNMKLRKKNTYIKEKNVLLNNKCDGNGIFIDVVIIDNMSENKLIDEFNRMKIRVLMPLMVFLDNLNIPHTPLKKLVENIAQKYSKKNENSKLCSQTIAIPWEKFLKEPVFLKSDIFPFKEYEFEGRMFYSYNNIEKVLKQRYGNNCLKKWNEDKQIYEETLPIEKRKPKHTIDLNLKGDEPPLKN